MKIVRIAALTALAAVTLSACYDMPMDKAKTEAKAPNLAFDAAVTVTPEAAQALKAVNDHITVTSHYYGFPAKGSESKANPIGQIALGSDVATASPDAPKVRFSGKGIDHSALDGVAGGTIYVWLSSRASTPQGVRDEILECSHFRGTVAKAQEAPVAITCDLAKAP